MTDKFPNLSLWCEFLKETHGNKSISKDTWELLLEFATQVVSRFVSLVPSLLNRSLQEWQVFQLRSGRRVAHSDRRLCRVGKGKAEAMKTKNGAKIQKNANCRGSLLDAPHARAAQEGGAEEETRRSAHPQRPRPQARRIRRLCRSCRLCKVCCRLSCAGVLGVLTPPRAARRENKRAAR